MYLHAPAPAGTVGAMTERVRVLCVCTHNRTRSVMMAGLLGNRLAELGLAGDVASVGFRSAGEPPTEQTVRLLSDRGIDASAHRSRTIDAEFAGSFDLVLTAEAAHVVQLAGAKPDLFARTFTLPEFVARAERTGNRSGLTVGEWVDKLGADRPIGLDYLDAIDGGLIGEVADPTGRGMHDWATAIDTIDRLTATLAQQLVARDVV